MTTNQCIILVQLIHNISHGNDSQGSSSETNNGISVSGNTITLDLKNSTFGSLNNPGDFVNLTSINLLVLKISNTEFRAFDNCCPHSGSKNSLVIFKPSLLVVPTEIAFQ